MSVDLVECDFCCDEKASCLNICSECLNEAYSIESKKACQDFADKIIKLVREMPNADDRYDKVCTGMIPKMLDGGSVHRFTLIERIEKLKELEGVEK